MVGEGDTNLAVKSSDHYCPCFPQNFNYTILIPIMEIILATLFCSEYLFISLILHHLIFLSIYYHFLYISTLIVAIWKTLNRCFIELNSSFIIISHLPYFHFN